MTSTLDAPASRRARRSETMIDGIPVSRRGFDETLALLVAWTRGRRFRRVATANLDFLAQASSNPELRGALATADLVTADGQPVVWLSRMQGEPVTGRVAGSDLVMPLARAAGAQGARVYLLGGTPAILEAVEQRFAELAPGLRVVGTYSGMVDMGDELKLERIVRNVRDSRADLLLVALGCPKQDLFLERYGARTGARLGIGVGATLEFVAGTKRRAPRWVQALALEWLDRLLREPRRLTGRYLRDVHYLARAVTARLLRGGRRPA
jgi:N-acetylglucosaminyldiphosphoundecaprenol N-acetyl-beta-D-mannosaminyltransferase